MTKTMGRDFFITPSNIRPWIEFVSKTNKLISIQDETNIMIKYVGIPGKFAEWEFTFDDKPIIMRRSLQ